MFDASNTPYQQQDIKPLLHKYITLTPNTLPDIHFLYDSDLITTQQPYDFVEFFFRKSGHVFEYTILTSLLLIILHYTKLDLRIRILVSFICAFLFACTDEYHQTFIAGRTGHFMDVYTFDSAGMILGIMIYLVIHTVKNRTRKKTS
jgi:VanZ family protein